MTREDILKELEQHKAKLTQNYGVTRIGIFGSVARNQANRKSDLDIVVDMPPNLLKRVALKIELEILFNKDVDVVRYWDGMNQYLKKRIDNEAIYVWKRCDVRLSDKK